MSLCQGTSVYSVIEKVSLQEKGWDPLLWTGIDLYWEILEPTQPIHTLSDTHPKAHVHACFPMVRGNMLGRKRRKTRG